MAQDILPGVYFGNSVLDYTMALGIVLASIVIGKVVYYLTNNWLRKLTGKTKSKLDDLLIDSLEEPLVFLIFIAGLYLASTTLTLPESIKEWSTEIVTALVILDAVWVIIRLVDIAVNHYIKPLTDKTSTYLDDQLLPIVRRGLKAVAVIIGVLTVMGTFGVNVTAVVAGLGIGGLAVALASKDTVENMFGAFAILLDKPFSINDRVVIDGITGDVMEVGLRSTRIRTLDNTELYIPNTKVVTSNIENISRPDRSLVVLSTISVTYDTELRKLREGMDAVRMILRETEGVSGEYTPTIVLKEFGSSGMNILVKYWVEDYEDRLLVMDRVNQRIKEEFEKAGIEFAFPTQTIHIAK
jgi:MscS family membrane protein